MLSAWVLRCNVKSMRHTGSWSGYSELVYTLSICHLCVRRQYNSKIKNYPSWMRKKTIRKASAIAKCHAMPVSFPWLIGDEEAVLSEPGLSHRHIKGEKKDHQYRSWLQ